MSNTYDDDDTNISADSPQFSAVRKYARKQERERKAAEAEAEELREQVTALSNRVKLAELENVFRDLQLNPSWARLYAASREPDAPWDYAHLSQWCAENDLRLPTLPKGGLSA